MNHKGTKTIETNKLVLRKLTLDDANSMFSNWCNDDEVTKFLTWPTHSSVDVTKKVLDEWTKEYEKDDYYQWGIELKDSNELVGSISVVAQSEENKTAAIGYCIGKKWWNQGITSEALSGVLKFLFDEVEFNRLEAQHDPENPHSGMVMKKAGLQYEGTLRKSHLTNRGIVDVCVYSILKEDYDKLK